MEPANMSLPTVLRSNLIVCITSCCCFFLSCRVCLFHFTLNVNADVCRSHFTYQY